MKRRSFLMTSGATIAAAAIGGFRLAQAAAPVSTLPMLAPWAGAHGGFPAFDKIRIADFKPALNAAMQENRAELAIIAGQSAGPTFENTIAALEDAGRTFGRVTTLFNVYTSTLNDKAMQAVEQELSPILAAFNDEIVQNAALFKRVKAVYDSRERAA